MKMLEITKERFDEFRESSPYNNYCQTSNYAMLMAETGFDYSYIAYLDNEDNILAASMFLIKKISNFYYAYSPKGFIIDYNDSDLVKRFVHNICKYFKRKKIIFLKINPEIEIATIDYKNNYERIENENINVLDTLKSLGFMKRKEIEPLSLLQPKLVALINLKDYDINKLDKKVRSNIKRGINNGLELEVSDASKIDILYEFIKNMKDRSINYYRNAYNSFKKDNLVDLLLVKVDYEKFLIAAKKRVEVEQVKNDELNLKLQNDANEKNLNEKMNSDKVLEEYKQDVVRATNGLKKEKSTYIAGAIVIKFNKKISIFIAGVDKNYNYLNPNYFLHHKIIEMYKDDYDILDLNGIANEFNEDSKFSRLNKFKMGFNPEIIEYIGELDIVINKWKFKILEQNNLLSNEFTKKKDTK